MHPIFVRKHSDSVATATSPQAIDSKAKMWTVESGRDGRLEKRFVPMGSNLREDAIIDALISASAEQDIAETRIW